MISSNNIALHASEFKANPLVNVFLGGLMDDVENTMNSIIQNAENATINVEIEAGRQLTIAIQNAKNAYQESLQMSVDKVETAIQDRLKQLDGMVQLFQAKNMELIKKMAQDVQLFINSLPFSKLNPQLKEASPKYVVLDSNSPDLRVNFSGNFPFSADPKYPPTLTFNNKPFKKIDSTTLNFIFEGPVDALFPKSTNAPTDKYAYSVGKLEIPWDNTENLPWYKRLLGYTDTKTYEYDILETALPLSPGRITAIYTSSQSGDPIRKRYVSATIHEDANHAYRKGKCGYSDVHRFSFNPDPEFKVILGTQALIVHPGAHGNHHEFIDGVSEMGVNARIEMDACSGKHMGIIDFHVEFDEIKPTTVEKIQQLPINLKWGESQVLPIKDANHGRLIKVVFASFDGLTNEFGTNTDLSNRYIKIYNQGDSLKLQAQPPADIALLKI